MRKARQKPTPRSTTAERPQVSLKEGVVPTSADCCQKDREFIRGVAAAMKVDHRRTLRPAFEDLDDAQMILSIWSFPPRPEGARATAALRWAEYRTADGIPLRYPRRIRWDDGTKSEISIRERTQCAPGHRVLDSFSLIRA